jgi:Flp pilus assembly protein TadD
VGSLLKEATASIEARRFQDAITALKRILELDPGNPDAHVQLGRAQANLGNLEAAEVRNPIKMRRNRYMEYRMIKKLDFLA